ncbi:ABC transporter ATP-binding protein [Lacisediminimonas profundi]|uniref:ABC transporter ATP-binding protein n=1 Tax=Lacisediminimonas profundi TaxID=2603856 RepID=UPI00124B2A12|nr:ABC transporter ATP-binding protein [Lacisediminimonas profundi]
MGETALLELDNVTKRFGSHIAVDRLTMSVHQGEIVALLGRTGAGKSTVMGLLMGSIGCDEGGVRVAGKDPSRDFQALRGKMSVSFQTDRLLPWRTALENVELGMQILDFPKDQIRPKAREWLRRVNLHGAEDKYVHELSGGMRQRVSLARALAVDPELLLLDESFSQLDHVTSQVLRRDFAQIVREYHKTCVFVTHRIDDALEMADRIFVLAAPASVRLELRLSAADRADPARMTQIHDQIAAAIGGPDE